MGFLDLVDTTTSSSLYTLNLSCEPFLLNIKGINSRSVAHAHGYSTFFINPNVDKTMLIENIYEYDAPQLDRPNNNIYQLEVSLTQTEQILPADQFVDYYFILRIYSD